MSRKRALRTRPGSRSVRPRRRPAGNPSARPGPFLLLAVSLGVVAWLVLSWTRGSVLSRLARVATVEFGVIEEVTTTSALVVRQEEVVTAPIGGTLYLLAGEGQRVRVGAEVARIVNRTARETGEKRLAAADSELQAFRAAAGEEESSLRAELSAVEGRLLHTIADMKAAIRERSYERVPSLQVQMEEMAVERAEHLARLGTLREEEARLEAERRGAEEVLARAAVTLTAPRAGVVSFQLDGLEDRLTPDAVSGLDVKTAVNLRGSATAGSAGDEVRPGRPVFKVLDTSRTYVVVTLPSREAAGLLQKGRVTLRRADRGVEAEAFVHHVGRDEQNGYRVVSFVAERAPGGFDGERRFNVDIVTARWQGVLVPRRALTEREGRQGVYVVREETAHFLPVDIRGEKGPWLAVEGVAEGSRVVLNPWTVRDGGRLR